MVKSLLGIEKTTASMMQRRVALCYACDQFSSGWRCKACGCIVSLKIRVASEECPMGKWKAEQGEPEP